MNSIKTIKTERLAKYGISELAEKSGMSYDAVRRTRIYGTCRYKTWHKLVAAMNEIDKSRKNERLLEWIPFTEKDGMKGVKTRFATIWFNPKSEYCEAHFTWHTWDKDGFGGENSIETTLEGAKLKATQAAIRQNFIKIERAAKCKGIERMKVYFNQIKVKTIDIPESELSEAIIREAKSGWSATHIDDNPILAFCDHCNRPVIEEFDYIVNVDGDQLCNDCIEKFKSEDV